MYREFYYSPFFWNKTYLWKKQYISLYPLNKSRQIPTIRILFHYKKYQVWSETESPVIHMIAFRLQNLKSTQNLWKNDIWYDYVWGSLDFKICSHHLNWTNLGETLVKYVFLYLFCGQICFSLFILLEQRLNNTVYKVILWENVGQTQ